MLAIKNESYQSVSNNWRHDTNVFMTFALLSLSLFFFHVVYTTQILKHYKAVLIFVWEVLQNSAKNKMIVETPLQGISNGVALS